MELVKYPDERLRRVYKDSSKLSHKERASLTASMWKIMNDNNGVGLAAPQVGLNIRMFTWRHYNSNMAVWNPVICGVSGTNNSTEGCLSLPGVIITKERSSTSRLIGIGLDGKQISLWGDYIHTQIWQHEISHLDGELIIDNMSLADMMSNQTALSNLISNKDCNK